MNLMHIRQLLSCTVLPLLPVLKLEKHEGRDKTARFLQNYPAAMQQVQGLNPEHRSFLGAPAGKHLLPTVSRLVWIRIWPGENTSRSESCRSICTHRRSGREWMWILKNEAPRSKGSRDRSSWFRDHSRMFSWYSSSRAPWHTKLTSVHHWSNADSWRSPLSVHDQLPTSFVNQSVWLSAGVSSLKRSHSPLKSLELRSFLKYLNTHFNLGYFPSLHHSERVRRVVLIQKLPTSSHSF